MRNRGQPGRFLCKNAAVKVLMDHSFDQKNATNTRNCLSNNHHFTVSGELEKDK
jgi:hypothetical protein